METLCVVKAGLGLVSYGSLQLYANIVLTNQSLFFIYLNENTDGLYSSANDVAVFPLSCAKLICGSAGLLVENSSKTFVITGLQLDEWNREIGQIRAGNHKYLGLHNSWRKEDIVSRAIVSDFRYEFVVDAQVARTIVAATPNETRIPAFTNEDESIARMRALQLEESQIHLDISLVTKLQNVQLAYGMKSLETIHNQGQLASSINPELQELIHAVLHKDSKPAQKQSEKVEHLEESAVSQILITPKEKEVSNLQQSYKRDFVNRGAVMQGIET
jgi:hypothetical protein